MILFIDTTDYDEVTLAVVDKQVVYHKFGARDLSEKLLPEIKKFLNKQKLNFTDLKKIAIVVGTGGFSRIRSAVSIGNAIAFSLKLQVISVQKIKVPSDLTKLSKFPSQKMIKPVYDRQPNITLPKK